MFAGNFSSWRNETLRKKRLNTIPYFTVLGQINYIYRHTETIYRKIRDHIQAFFGQWKYFARSCLQTTQNEFHFGLQDRFEVISGSLNTWPCKTNLEEFELIYPPRRKVKQLSFSIKSFHAIIMRLILMKTQTYFYLWL